MVIKIKNFKSLTEDEKQQLRRAYRNNAQLFRRKRQAGTKDKLMKAGYTKKQIKDIEENLL